MTLSQAGIDYICNNFGLQACCVESGIAWYYTAEGQVYPENGGTAQIVSRLASGLIESLTITNPDRGAFTKTELDAANGSAATLQDAQLIAKHDTQMEGQWCEGSTPTATETQTPWALIAGAGIALVLGVIILKR